MDVLNQEIIRFVVSKKFISQQQVQQILEEQKTQRQPLLHILAKYLTPQQKRMLEQKISTYALEEQTEKVSKSHLIKIFYSDNGTHQEQETIPKNFGKFEIIRELGRGNMGRVFLAKDPQREGYVALKVMLAGEMADPIADKRFVREAESIKKLNHPNIIKVYEVGREKGIRYFTMKYIHGPSFAEVLRHEIDIQKSVEILAKVARAVHYAHSNNIVHRDIKPENVILENDHPIVTDFGLARPIHSDSKLTSTGVISGTAHYMAPEQIKKIGTIDARTDIYALGASLYRALSGRTPFQGREAFDVLSQVLHKEPSSLRKINPCIPEQLEKICFKAMAKNKEKRFANALEMAKALEHYLKESREQKDLPAKNKWIQQALAAILAFAFIMIIITIIQEKKLKNPPVKTSKAKSHSLKQSKKSIASKKVEIKIISHKDIELAKNYFDLGTRCMKQNMYSKALSFFNSALKLYPQYAKAYSRRGQCYFHRRQFSLAVADLNKAIELKPTNSNFYNSRGNIYRKSKQFRKAIDSYNKAIELNPENTKIYYNRAIGYRQIKLYAKSIADFTKAMQMEPNDARIYANRAKTYKAQEKYDKAILDLTRSIEIFPNMSVKKKKYYIYSNSMRLEIALEMRAFCYYKIGKYHEAMMDLQDSLELNPKSGITYNYRGLVHFEKGEYRRAMSDFSTAIKFSPQYSNAYLNRASLHQLLGNEKKARDDLIKYRILCKKK